MLMLNKMDSFSIEDFNEEFLEKIRSFLHGVNTLAILGVGNEDNGDDAVGLKVINILKEKTLPDWVKLYYCERVPEHFIGKLEKLKPNRIIVIDAADMKDSPGVIAIFPKEIISKEYNFSTHTLSLTMLEEFLSYTIHDLDILYVGIQPKYTVFESPLSEECLQSAIELSELIFFIINESEKNSY